jgi:hypothetical protein
VEPVSEDHAGRVYLARQARRTLARLDAGQRETLQVAFSRVGRELVASAERADVERRWTRRTWPRRRYPQQCYSRTARYVLGHADIEGMRLVHGVASHAPRFVPFDHAWVEMPGDIVFDGVVQMFFKRGSYYGVMSAMPLDAYSPDETRQLVDLHRHPGPWNASWVPTTAQLVTYTAALRACQAGGSASPLPENVGRKR